MYLNGYSHCSVSTPMSVFISHATATYTVSDLFQAENLETATSPQHGQPQQTAMAPPPSSSRHTRDMGVSAVNVGVATEPEHLGPCEPGTAVGLEGIVWKETDNGEIHV